MMSSRLPRLSLSTSAFDFRSIGLLATLVMLLSCSGTCLAAQKTVSFQKDIKPIFDNHCLDCHGPEEEEAFRIDDRDDTLNYVIAGEPEESTLYEYLVSDDEDELMPPADFEKPLSSAQITLVKTWIAEGADWPAGDEGADDEEDDDEEDDDEEAADDNAAAALDDHANDDAANEPAEGDAAITTQELANAGGSLHPAAVHLPIGLLLAAGLFALLSLRGNFVMSDCAYYCLWLGALGAIGACVTGWFYSPMEHRGTVNVFADLWDQSHPVYWHRTVALGTSIFALVMALMAASARARDPDDGTLWKLGAIVLAGLIGWVGHQGGELTYGKKHYKDLNSIVNKLVPGLLSEEQGGAGQEKPAADDAKDEAKDAVKLDDEE